MQFTRFYPAYLLLLSGVMLSWGALAAASPPVSSESFIERAKRCFGPGMVFHGEQIEADLFEIRVTLITCDEDYFWYEGVCGHTEEAHLFAFAREDGKLLRAPAGCK